jgi:hypothetical protein
VTLLFSFIDENKRPLGRPVEVYHNTVMSGLDERLASLGGVTWCSRARFGSGHA